MAVGYPYILGYFKDICTKYNSNLIFLLFSVPNHILHLLMISLVLYWIVLSRYIFHFLIISSEKKPVCFWISSKLI